MKKSDIEIVRQFYYASMRILYLMFPLANMPIKASRTTQKSTLPVMPPDLIDALICFNDAGSGAIAVINAKPRTDAEDDEIFGAILDLLATLPRPTIIGGGNQSQLPGTGVFQFASAIARVLNGTGIFLREFEQCAAALRRQITLATIRAGNPQVTPMQSEVDDTILEAMTELRAIDKKNLKSAAIIVKRAFGIQADYNSYKRNFSELVKIGKIQSAGGSKGGYWLTSTSVT